MQLSTYFFIILHLFAYLV